MTFRLSILFIAFFVVLGLCAAPRSNRPPLQVLFIGNSYTFVNNVPGQVQALAKAKGVRMETTMVAPGGYSLGAHWQDGTKPNKARAVIAGKKWDFVILQDQSSMPAIAPNATLKAAKDLCTLIRKQGATPIFYLTPAHYSKPKFMEEEQQALSATYVKAARANNGRVALVGPAFMESYRKKPQLKLHQQDNSHFSLEGSYLAACVITSTILNQPTSGLPGVRGMTQSTIKYLQTISDNTVKNRNAVISKIEKAEKVSEPAAANDHFGFGKEFRR